MVERQRVEAEGAVERAASQAEGAVGRAESQAEGAAASRGGGSSRSNWEEKEKGGRLFCEKTY